MVSRCPMTLATTTKPLNTNPDSNIDPGMPVEQREMEDKLQRECI